MLSTFVIGLREGLEAVLVVSIIATFLRRNGASLRPLWYGVGAALVLFAGWPALAGLRGRRAVRTPGTPGGDGAPDSPPADAGRPGRKHHVSHHISTPR